MNTVTFPPDHHATTDRPAEQQSALARWLSNAQYMTVSTLLHLILVIMLGGTVLYQQAMETPDFAAPPGGLVGEETTIQPPQPDQAQVPQADFSPTAPTNAAVNMASSQVTAIVTTATNASSFSASAVATPNMPIKINSAPAVGAVPKMSGNLSKESAGKIAAFTSGWAVGGRSTFGQPLKSRKFEFTAYLAKYAGGDWDSTVWMDGTTMRGGSLQNLLFVINKLSKAKINAQPQPVPLDLSSSEIFEKKPPFIFFTGHRDFKLSDKELENLAEYLRVGGCIWGDSSLPGQRSRFDIAFRREMRRLLPDPQIQWQALPPSHPIYTNTYYPEIKAVPPGINFYHEPIYALQGYGGEIAVIYTANDYGDMWQFGIDDKGEIDLSRDEKRRMVAVNEEMWHRRNLYFGNIDSKALFDTYKFGTNIVVHLLTRWEQKTRFAALSEGR